MAAPPCPFAIETSSRMCYIVNGSVTVTHGGRMKTLSIREMRGALTRLEELLKNAGELLITRRGRGIARLVPVDPARQVPSHRHLRAAMEKCDVGSEELVRADRDGR